MPVCAMAGSRRRLRSSLRRALLVFEVGSGEGQLRHTDNQNSTISIRQFKGNWNNPRWTACTKFACPDATIRWPIGQGIVARLFAPLLCSAREMAGNF